VAVGSVLGVLGHLPVTSIAGWAKCGTAPAEWRLHVYLAMVVLRRRLTVFMLFEILDGVSTLWSTDTALGYLEQALVAACEVGIGAVYLVRLTSSVDATCGLTRLRHLRAGAAYVLGVLSVLLWASLVVPVPGVVAGWVGTVIIGAALLTSLPWRRPRRISTG
jgi:hypothetical protein